MENGYRPQFAVASSVVVARSALVATAPGFAGSATAAAACRGAGPGGGDVVPIVVDHGRARVAVNFANYPLPQTMVIDTGASIMSVTNELAAALIDRGMAYRMDQQTNIGLADGACQRRDQIMVYKLSIGGHTAIDVPAIMAPDNVEMLLPFGVLNQAGKFSIDSTKGLLIFG